MNKRPTSITVLSWLCILFGVGGFIINFDWIQTSPIQLIGSKSFGMTFHMLDPTWRIYLYPRVSYSDMHPLAMWLFPAQWFFLALCGVFMLRGFNWARWILVAWVGYHFFQSLAHTRFELMFEVFYDAHSPWELLVHSLLYVMILYAVFHPAAGRYFRGARAAV